MGEKAFSDIILQAAKRCIPAGRIANFPREASQLAEQRDALRKQYPAEPRLKTMDMQIGALTNAKKDGVNI